MDGLSLLGKWTSVYHLEHDWMFREVHRRHESRVVKRGWGRTFQLQGPRTDEPMVSTFAGTFVTIRGTVWAPFTITL